MAALTVPTIFTAVDKLSSVISKMQGNVSKFASETQKKYAQMSRSAQEWQTNFSQIGMAAGIVGAAIITPLGFATKAASDFEDQMANVATLVDTSKESIKDMGNQVLDVFTKAPVKLDDLTEALYKIRSAGIPAAQAMDVLSKSAILGIAGRGTTLQAGDAITSAINVFKDEGLSTNKIASMLFETVKQGKTTIEGMSESFGATANIVHNGGVKLNDFLSATAAMTVMGEPATQAMNQIRASVFGLEKPTTRMKFLFKELGVRDVHGLISKFGDLGNAMSAIEDKGKSLGVNMGQAWGKVGAYAAVIALTGNSKGAYNKNLLGMNNSDADLAAAYADKLNTMKAQSQLLQNELQYFGIKVGTALLPVLVSLAKAIAPVVEWFGKWIDNNPTLAKVIIVTTAAIGALLLVIAPLAFAISGIAGVVKIWAGLNLWLAGTSETVAAAVGTETTAIVAQETAVAALSGEFAIAETAAASFGAVLSSLAIPAAVLAFVGYQAYQGIKENTHHDVNYWDQHKKHNYLQENLSYWANQHKQSADAQAAAAMATQNVGFRKFMPANNGKGEALAKALLPAISQNIAVDSTLAKDPNIIHLMIDDKGNHVKSVTSSGPLNIPHTLKQGSTTGNK